MKFARRPEPSQRRPRRTAEVLSKKIESDNERIDPAQEITPADWEMETSALDRYQQEQDWDRYVSSLASIFSLFPEQRPHIQVDERSKRGMQRIVSGREKKLQATFDSVGYGYHSKGHTYAYQVDAHNFLTGASEYLTVFPDDRERIPLDNKRSQLLDYLHEARRKKDWFGFQTVATNYAMLFSGAQKELHLDTKLWDALVDSMGVIPPTGADPIEGRIFRDFARCLCVLFPGRKHELVFSDDVWKLMRDEKQTKRIGIDRRDVFVITRDMMIFDADKIEILPNGELKLSKKSPKMKQEEPVPPRPQL